MAKVKKGQRNRKTTPTKPLTRKELRKKKQLEKKENKRLYFSNKKQNKQANKTTITTSIKNAKTHQIGNHNNNDYDGTDENESIDSDFVDTCLPAPKPPLNKQGAATAKKVKIQTAPPNDAATVHLKELKKLKDLQQASRKQRVKQLSLDNEEENKNIASLEKKLKLNKTKNKNRLVRKMFNDGLDYALECCLDDDEQEKRQRLPKDKCKMQPQTEDIDDSESSEKDVDSDIEGDDHKCNSDDNASKDTDDDDDNALQEMQEEKITKEDIYGRTLDKDGNVLKQADISDVAQPQKYLPPQLRAKQSTFSADSKNAELMLKLRRQTKGLLNRLSAVNLHKIATGIEELYTNNSRYHMNETLAALLSEALLLERSMSNERMVQEHIVLLAYLHANVGSEIGAYFLQLFVQQFDQYLQQIDVLQVEDKRLNNLTLLLAYLYIFKIYEHRLLLELIHRLAEALCEKSIECLLLIFQSVGFKLRKDDPLAFKEMMLSVQQKIAAAPLELKENLRLKFMVDILNAVKNNNINKIPQFDPQLAEMLQKHLRAMLRHDKYVVTLNITMADLLRAEQAGKWWIVGSAWSGNVDDLGAAAKHAMGKKTTSSTQRFSEKLLSLAKKQKMNTDERRNIFCIVMGSEDYIDAFEKILHLALKDQRSVAAVIIHCCLNETQSNPYYAHLALKFCNYNRKFQLAFQFAAWDRIHDLQALTAQQIRNLSGFLLYLLLNGGLMLSVLKVVNFLQLDKSSFLLTKEIMLGLLLAGQESDARKPFEHIAKNPKLNAFKNSIRLFLQHFLLKNESAKLELPADRLALLERRIDAVESILAYVDL